MASIQPFRALRPAPDAAPRVSSVPYDVVSTDEARQLAAGNPLSFLRVTRSEIDLPADTDPYSDAVYAKARENLRVLRERAPLVLEESQALYLYRLRMGAHEQTGVAGCFSIDEYERDIIKKHERTRRDKEDDRTRHIVEVRAQTGIVFLTYRRSAAVDDLQSAVTNVEPLYDFATPDGVQHTVWRPAAEHTRTLVEAFAHIDALYIADGHHRAASAARARRELTGQRGNAGDANSFIAVAFPDDQVKILPYHRVVKDLGGRSAEQFYDVVREKFPVRDGSAVPHRKGEVSMFLAGHWYTISVDNVPTAGDSRAASLDVARLQRGVLDGILGIKDITTDKRIDFVGGARGTAVLERAVDSGKAAVAFSMYPVSVDDLIAISDAGGIMPPKSTWFEPKLRDGLLVHLV
jgi:uncharacterized protein (DUF1015 family)